MDNKDFFCGVAAGVLSAAVVVTGGYLGYQQLLSTDRGVLSDPGHVQKLEYLEQLIDEQYLEEKDEDELAEGIYTGLLYGLGDPYSRYYTAEEYAQENTVTEGAYVGIGVLMQKNREGGVQIVECYEGGPGEIAGLEAGDIISAIDSEDITDKELSDVVEMIRNSSEESVVLTVHREDMDEALEITVPIKDVVLPSVFHEMLDEKVGYLRISEFTGVTPEQYRTAFAELKEQGMEKLVIDLRNNPGGLLNAVCDVLEEILPEGLIVYTEDKYGNRDERSCEGSSPLEMPLAVLVNEGSASASEIFAGAVQDYGIGTIVGVTTYGKGVVQAITPLEDGSAVKMTVSRYYTPKGNSIHEVGIKPDVEVKLDASLLNKEEISYEEDNQLQEALDVLDQS